MNIKDRVAIVTGAGSGIGEAVAVELAKRGVRGLAMVDVDPGVENGARAANELANDSIAQPYVGEVTDAAFRQRVFADMKVRYGRVHILVPAAGITRDALSVQVDRQTGAVELYSPDTFRLVMEVNLIAPIYWALQLVGEVAAERRDKSLGRWVADEEIQGTVILIGSVSSLGNKGQLAYATAKAGLEGAAATLMAEAIFHGVRCALIHPGYTDTPMVRELGEDFINQRILPQTQLKRLIRPEEIADAVCFMIDNAAFSGRLWADAGWHPPA